VKCRLIEHKTIQGVNAKHELSRIALYDTGLYYERISDQQQGEMKRE